MLSKRLLDNFGAWAEAMLLSSASKHLGSMNDVPSLDEETFSDFFSYPTCLVWHHGEGDERL